jgi:hypothetical protein
MNDIDDKDVEGKDLSLRGIKWKESQGTFAQETKISLRKGYYIMKKDGV